MKFFLTKTQEDMFETKVLNAVLSCFEEVKKLEGSLVETQQRLSEVIDHINAAALNTDISEDVSESDIIAEDLENIDWDNVPIEDIPVTVEEIEETDKEK